MMASTQCPAIYNVSMANNLFSTGALLGTTGSKSLIDSINQRSGAAIFFGSENDPRRTDFQSFVQVVITPLRESNAAGSALRTVTDKLINNDCIMAIDSLEKLKSIPPRMHLPILYMPQVREQLENGCIDGFGIKPSELDDYDIYENVLDSGYVEFTSEDMTDDGEIVIEFKQATDDPELTDEEIEAIRLTRAYIEQFLDDPETSYMDVTNYPSLHA